MREIDDKIWNQIYYFNNMILNATLKGDFDKKEYAKKQLNNLVNMLMNKSTKCDEQKCE